MLKLYTFLFLTLFCITVSNSFGQNKLDDNIVNDSLIRIYKIKQVTENWFLDSLKTSPSNTTVEKYNESGQKTQRIHINYSYHKFVDDYDYNLKKNVLIITQHYYDWNPYRAKRKGDTIVEITVSKYDITSSRKLKTKPTRFEEFKPKETFDNFGRTIKRIDTAKCGHNITYYTYDNNAKLVEKKYYTSLHSEAPNLYAVDSLHYNLKGQLVKETNYHNIEVNGDKYLFDREVITTYNYAESGLILEKTSTTKYQSLNNGDFKPTVYRYEYEFY